MTFFSSLAWTGISFLLFTVLVAVISAWKTRDEQLDTAEGYFLAGRGLPGVVIAGSLLLTNLSAEQLVGLNGQSWKNSTWPDRMGGRLDVHPAGSWRTTSLPKLPENGRHDHPVPDGGERYGKGHQDDVLAGNRCYVLHPQPAGHPVLRCSRFRADLRHLRHPRHQQVHGCCHPVPSSSASSAAATPSSAALKAVAVSDTHQRHRPYHRRSDDPVPRLRGSVRRCKPAAWHHGRHQVHGRGRSGQNERHQRMECTGTGSSVAADHQPVCSSTTCTGGAPTSPFVQRSPRSKEPEGRPEGRYLLRASSSALALCTLVILALSHSTCRPFRTKLAAAGSSAIDFALPGSDR